MLFAHAAPLSIPTRPIPTQPCLSSLPWGRSGSGPQTQTHISTNKYSLRMQRAWELLGLPVPIFPGDAKSLGAAGATCSWLHLLHPAQTARTHFCFFWHSESKSLQVLGLPRAGCETLQGGKDMEPLGMAIGVCRAASGSHCALLFLMP